MVEWCWVDASLDIMSPFVPSICKRNSRLVINRNHSMSRTRKVTIWHSDDSSMKTQLWNFMEFLGICFAFSTSWWCWWSLGIHNAAKEPSSDSWAWSCAGGCRYISSKPRTKHHGNLRVPGYTPIPSLTTAFFLRGGWQPGGGSLRFPWK